MRANAPRWFVLIASLIAALVGECQGASPKKKPKVLGVESERTRGERLFVRTWAPDDPRSRGGDGLGPVFNARSCIACHGLAGPGGGGTNEVNVELLTALPARFTRGAAPNPREIKPLDRLPLIALHPRFAETSSLVLHRFGLDPDYPAWREHAQHALDPPKPAPSVRGSIGFAGSLQTRMGREADVAEPPPPPDFRLVISQRNTPALFGAGLIDTIPDAAIEAEERRQAGRPVHGRISRLKGGHVGRFGWKAQVARLDDFVLTACANEMGLEVPDHAQAIDPLDYGRPRQRGLDMAQDDCQRLVAYVASLPAPEERATPFLESGRQRFMQVGCAECHRPTLGRVDGIYSDLLVHDMGPNLTDSGVYYGQDEESSPGVPKSPDWRTPPLWGVADSAPYLHDGRAPTLAAAIQLHGGEAASSVERYQRLSTAQRAELIGFLRALKVRKASRLTNRDIRLADEEFLPFLPHPAPLADSVRWPGLGPGLGAARTLAPFEAH